MVVPRYLLPGWRIKHVGVDTRVANEMQAPRIALHPEYAIPCAHVDLVDHAAGRRRQKQELALVARSIRVEG